MDYKKNRDRKKGREILKGKSDKRITESKARQKEAPPCAKNPAD
jgi:hypothetical protein